MTATTTATARVAGSDRIDADPRPHESAASLLARARSLRNQARHVNPVLADAYLRRAAELSLEAWARAVRSAPVDVDRVVAHAGAPTPTAA